MTPKKVRILDIALQAGVSTATVDRVMNKRPGVSQGTIDKVNAAVAELENGTVRPRVLCSKGNTIKICALISKAGGFANELLASALRTSAERHGMELDIRYIARMNPIDQVEAICEVLDKNYHGVLIQPLDHPLVRDAIKDLKTAGIPAVCLLSSLPDSKAIGYVGLDNRAAGRTAGLLMGRLVRRPGKVAIIAAGPLYRSQEEREFGFQSVMRHEFPELCLLAPSEGGDSPKSNNRIINDLLKAHPDLVGVLSVGAGNRGIEPVIRSVDTDRRPCLITFNLTPLTREGLLFGSIDAVIHQDHKRISETALSALSSSIWDQEPSFDSISVEIIMRENVR